MTTDAPALTVLCPCGHAAPLRVICEDEAKRHRSFHVQSPAGSGSAR